ncbi:hypothetical protein [Deinococcus pimensis]|uniref:hypothetical protein n=1 Tax=Deinococcus pimensis TaxID=309888 RepID=UPI000481D4CE|nr:hypothetical protein [Deinococcus pimensis]
MKHVLLLVLAAFGLTFTACAPRTALATGAAAVQRDPGLLVTGTYDGKAILPSDTAVTFLNRAAEAATGDPNTPGDPLALLVTGTPDLTPDAGAAKVCEKSPAPAPAGWWRCRVPNVAAQSYFTVAFQAGKVRTASLSFYRPTSGPRPILLFLGPAGQ